MYRLIASLTDDETAILAAIGTITYGFLLFGRLMYGAGPAVLS